MAASGLGLSVAQGAVETGHGGFRGGSKEESGRASAARRSLEEGLAQFSAATDEDASKVPQEIHPCD